MRNDVTISEFLTWACAARLMGRVRLVCGGRQLALFGTLVALGLTALTDVSEAVDCDNVKAPYTVADISLPMRFFYPESAVCFGNAVNTSYLAVGHITAQTPAKFAEFAKDNRPDAPIEFVSLGGDLMAGLELGKMIRNGGYDTALGDQCASACAYAILGGLRRYIILKDEEKDFDHDSRIVGATGTKLGVHQFYLAEALTAPLRKAFTAADMSADQARTGMLLEYTLRMGVDTRLVSAASGKKPNEIHWLTTDEMLAWNVDNVQRRYSTLVLRSLGASGSYVEVRNIRGSETSYLRLFCRRSVKQPLFDFITDIQLRDDLLAKSAQHQVRAAKEQIRSLLSRVNIAFEFESKQSLVLPLQIQEVQGELQDQGVVRVSAVLRPEGFIRDDAEKLTRVALEDNGNLGRSEWTFQDIAKFRVRGDHKLIGLAMRNCVE